MQYGFIDLKATVDGAGQYFTVIFQSVYVDITEL